MKKILPRAATHGVNRDLRCCRNSQQTGCRNVRGFAAAATAGHRTPQSLGTTANRKVNLSEHGKDLPSRTLSDT